MTILIIDKNPHVRDFLKREIEKTGHRVVTLEKGSLLAGDGLFLPPGLSLVVIDPDMPDIGMMDILEKMYEITKKKEEKPHIPEHGNVTAGTEAESRFPDIPVILHAHGSVFEDIPETIRNSFICVEKNGNSVENLIMVIKEMRKEAI